ncbi:MAG: hypothetical protein RMJ66_06905, partial [Bacteroidia bacterium]|nr:hypothetical protein [Bacteroidia bacterium]MDW8134782.1 hypothetical protein [Bacteroidia bacterium]
YLKKSVIVDGNPYGIDTNRIYVGGSSAGAFTAMHAAFLWSLSELAQVPEADTAYLRTQGGIEGNSGNLGYSSRFTAAFALSGGILRTAWVDQAKLRAVVAMHGTGDGVVPYRRGNLPFIFLEVEGGFNLDSVASEKGLYHALFSWQGLGHVPYGTQQSVNPIYMRDVEDFLRYHFYQWNSRFTSALSDATSREVQSTELEAWSIEGRYLGAINNLSELPQGVWILRSKSRTIRRLFRP